jgi:Fur family transcriptional regulator, peroxide stress response regulator
MITNSAGLKNTLILKGIKPTYQRTAILGFVLNNRTHPTIKSLHDKLVKSIPTLSKTTLYSTLELFAAKGLVTPLTIDQSEARYDGMTSPHHHFSCERCGRIIDIDVSCATSRRGEIEGHRIKEVHGYFKGICKDCLKQINKTQKRRSIYA